MTVNGPLRLILIHSGVYDYAEIDLWRSGHLVAHNNAGKTSLIATLQFLYLDRQNKWSFSKSREETRRFYFTTDRSFVIFECLTREGIKTVVIRGLGKLQAYDFERWVYDGEYRREDFLDGKQIRDPASIKTALAERNLRKVEPAEYRQVLTGVGSRRELPRLGLVPVREAKQYDHFVQLFGHLINLERMTQGEFKQLLLEVNKDEIPVPRIDLYRDYAGVYEKLRKRTESLRQFEAARSQVREVLDDAQRREALRGRVPLLWQRYTDKYKAERSLYFERIAQREEQLEALSGQLETLGGQMGELQDRLTGIGRRLGPVEQDLERLASRRAAFDGFVVELAGEELNNLKTRLGGLREQIAVSKREAAAAVAKRLEQNERRRREAEQRLERLATSLASLLRQRFDDATLRQVFTLANPDLLGQGEGGVSVHDEAALVARIEAVAARLTDGVYDDGVLRVALDGLQAPELGRYTDPETIRAEIAELAEQIARDREALEAAQRREALEAEVATLERELEQRAERLRQYHELQAEAAQERAWGEQLSALRAEEAEVKAAIAAIEQGREEGFAQRERLRGERAEAERGLNSLNKRNREIDELCQRRREMFDWQPAGDPFELPETLEAAETGLKQALLEELQLSQNIQNGLRRLRESAYHEQFMGDYDDEAATLAALAERLEAAEAWRQSVQEDWQGLVKHISHEIKRLIDGLEALKRRVHELNRQVAGTPISNLRELRVEINADRDRLGPLELLAEQTSAQAALSFGESAELSLAEAQERIGEILRRQAALSLTDLFTVSFWVVRHDGREDLYHQLDGVESNGTTITIKVVLFVLLLRSLFDRRQAVSFPFYLDEVSALDEQNARRIVQLARSLNFVPILASPTEMDAAEVIYELRPGSNGRLVVGPEHRVEIERDLVVAAAEEAAVEEG